MTNNQLTYPKEKLAKWILTLTLFLSFLAITGNAANSQFRLQHRAQTELVISKSHKIAKRAISYKKSLVLTYTNDGSDNSFKTETRALLIYNKLTRVKLDCISKQFISLRIAYRFLRAQRIPQQPNEGLFPSTIG